MVEIGDGFRLPDLLASTGARLREVGTTNRTSIDDYLNAVNPDTGFVLKVHPSNFVIRGFTSGVDVTELKARLSAPIVVDIGSGLLRPDPLLPDEPDAATALRDGADLVTASGDKLLGGPQAGLLLGDAALVERLRRHPLARALRVDKLTLAALQATLAGPQTPTWQALRADPEQLRQRTEQARAKLAENGVDVTLVASRRRRRWRRSTGGHPRVVGPLRCPRRTREPLRRAQPTASSVGSNGAGCCSTCAASRPARTPPCSPPYWPSRGAEVHVLATAGHVDHGKSTLVRALTGMEPDRWAEERRRGMTIDLGFAWTTLPSGATVAFVDVPGHERFVPNMLAGVGPVPAAMLVVAADEGWMPQSAEHLAALHALDVRHGLLVVTRSDLADPDRPAIGRSAEIAASTSLGDVDAVAVSGVTGAGLDDLRAALDRLVARLPAPDADGPVRLWIDRAFTIKGAGTVVTGTLGAGRIRVGDELSLGHPARLGDRMSLDRPCGYAACRASVPRSTRSPRSPGWRSTCAASTGQVGRGDALLTPGRFRFTDLVDVRVHGDPVGDLPATLTLHAGSAAVPCGSGRSARTPPGCGWAGRCRCGSATGRCCATRAATTSPAE